MFRVGLDVLTTVKVFLKECMTHTNSYNGVYQLNCNLAHLGILKSLHVLNLAEAEAVHPLKPRSICLTLSSIDLWKLKPLKDVANFMKGQGINLFSVLQWL